MQWSGRVFPRLSPVRTAHYSDTLILDFVCALRFRDDRVHTLIWQSAMRYGSSVISIGGYGCHHVRRARVSNSFRRSFPIVVGEQSPSIFSRSLSLSRRVPGIPEKWRNTMAQDSISSLTMGLYNPPAVSGTPSAFWMKSRVTIIPGPSLGGGRSLCDRRPEIETRCSSQDLA